MEAIILSFICHFGDIHSVTYGAFMVSGTIRGHFCDFVRMEWTFY